jgi:OOP family OmpA-OmpF porin
LDDVLLLALRLRDCLIFSELRKESMTLLGLRRMACIAVLSIFSLVFVGETFAAQTVKVEGLIKGRSGDRMILKTSQAPNLVVILTDETDVAQVKGVLKARRKDMSMAALIPGLAVKVEGTYNDEQQLVAKTVRFKGSDLQEAQAIQAGMHETQVQTQENKAELEAQSKALQQQETNIAANKASIEANVARFGQLDDYYIMDEVTVYFGNGKVDVDPKYNSQLDALAQKAKNINGYMIEVKGYASATGSVALNQKLSEDRAQNVTSILLQQAKVPLTRMLAPGAMGESEQVGNEKTEEGQAENRRVVVRVLQNKAIAGV